MTPGPLRELKLLTPISLWFPVVLLSWIVSTGWLEPDFSWLLYLKLLEKFLHYCMADLVFPEWMDRYSLMFRNQLEINFLTIRPTSRIRSTCLYVSHAICYRAYYYVYNSWQFGIFKWLFKGYQTPENQRYCIFHFSFYL